MDDERCLHRFPVRRKIRRSRRRILGLRARGQRIQLRILRIEHAGALIQASHLDAAPEAAEGQPRVPFAVEHEVRIDGVEVIARNRAQHQAVVHPLVVGTGWIKRLVRGQRNARRVLSKERIRVVQPIHALLERDIRCPQVYCSWAVFVNPFRDLVEDLSAELPCLQVVRASNLKLPAGPRPARRERVPCIAGLDDGRIVRAFKIA